MKRKKKKKKEENLKKERKSTKTKSTGDAKTISTTNSTISHPSSSSLI
jgi:hypothetical protein